MQLSIQVCPAPDEVPAGAVIIQRHDPDGEPMPCQFCDGTGRLDKYRGEPCRKCAGSGHGKFIWAARYLIRTAGQIDVAVEWLDSLDQSRHRVDRTIGLAETGGGYTNTGHATIVCGLRGEPLPSVGGRAVCGGEHARFWVHAAMLIEYGHHRGQGCGDVSLVAIDRRAPQMVGIQHVRLWEFDDDLSEVVVRSPEYLRHNYERETIDLEFPREAVQAAMRKSRDYHCRSAYYAAGTYAHGPSGALRGAGAACGGLPSPHKGPGIGYTS